MQELNQLWMQSAVQFTGKGAAPATESGSSSDRFDTLLRNKYDSAKSDAGSTRTDDTPQSEPKTDAVEGKDGASAKEPESEGTVTSSEDVQSEAEVVPMEQYAAAAGLMGLVQVDVQYEDAAVPVEEALVEVEPMELIPEASIVEEEVPAALTEVPMAETSGEVVQPQTQESVLSEAPEATDAETETVPVTVQSEPEAETPVTERMVSRETSGNGERQTSETDVQARRTLPEEVETVEEQPEDVPEAETPLFRTEDGVPVKVAEPKQAAETPIPLESKDGARELTAAVMDVVQGGGSEKVILTLTPASLGTVSVELTRGSDGTLSVLLTASTPKAAALLDQHAANLQQALAASEQRDVHVEVQRNEESHEQYLNPDDQQRQDQQQQRQQSRREREGEQPQDFFQRLRLGLVDLTE